MIEKFINFYNNIPELWRHSVYRLKMQKNWFLYALAIGIVLILGLTLILKLIGMLDIKQATILYRLVGLNVFGIIWIAIYINYRFYPRDYYVTRHYNTSPLLYLLISSALYSGILLVLMLVIALVKPVSADTAIWGVIYYTIMSFCFIFIFSFLLGMIYILYPNLDRIYIVITILIFLILPVIFIPNATSHTVTHILMMNPVYYLVNGMQQSVIVGHNALNHLSYHLYFLSFMGLIIVFCFALNDYVSQLRPNEHVK
ncbi:teichoic acid translocation permease [Staphylococcus canis]|uniref:Teichoic acid translocation permease n=1 Tax=Staphylococcus canis TaxID=2724942 RepID=A0ABS0T7I3_9STAP|nr:teichoic acid translocation permease [Staphylococcus canis]MBI5974714.1 teichoic acid translocation permease [Staphylococcus canis]